MEMTRAIVITAPHRLELRDVTLIDAGPDDVVVQTAYTSVSAGTERMLLAGRMPHPMLQFPVVPGYETVGRVIRRGAAVPSEYDGRWVYVGGARCFHDVNPAWGGQSAVLLVDYRRVIPLDGVQPDHGVLLALAATALHGIDLIAGADQNLTGRRVLVLGQGPVGQFAARIARARGAWVAVSDRVASRLERSVADVRIDVTAESLSAVVQQSVDTVIEATGSMAALSEALSLLANDGAVLLLGYYDELRLPYMPLFLKQARILTAKEWAAGDLQRSRDMLADGVLDAAALITHRMPVEQFESAYATALNDPECLKLVIEWDGSVDGVH
ncbi:zinc-binding dehydrogenase [Roseiflexus sp.]|uniref:zinc-binding dehydrogenase n=1 Tax=Roseiflexus sp. TaxID=2562120 RepID=UPI00398A9A5F